MSRYRPEYRSSGDLPYREAPTARWDRDSFARAERDRYGPPIIEQRPPYAEPYSPPRRSAPVYEEERYYESDRYGPGGRQERRYYEDDYYRDDPRAAGGAMIPFRPERPARPEPPAPVAPPRLLRRQSSLDFYDRRGPRRYDYDDHGPPPPRGPPRRGGYEVEQRQYDDVQVQDPYAYGDDGFREYREREWVRKRRNSSGGRSRSRSRPRSEFVESTKEEEKPYPRRGKTRMPKRLVHTKVLYDLGYPYYEEDEKTILIEKALGPDNIDEVFTMSKEYFARETHTTRLIEAPPAETVREVKIEKDFKEIDDVRTLPLEEAPRSVRDWDALSVRSGAKSARSRSRRRSRRGSSPGETVKQEIIEKKEKIIEREVSPARTHRSHKHRDFSPTATSRSGSEVFVEKKIIREEDDFDESNSVHVGPLALVVDRHPDRSDRDIKEEIRRLEAERKALRRERRYEREGGELIKIERVRERSPSPVGEVIVADRRGDEILEVRKDKRGRMSLVR
ncbi:uncharacterized protein HMPREF1541_01812 [Cyphellophora europaea CBS 101466]|uniref:DUF8035 domain-containing protein n=1 Tax=Cyphellophora europaea (strain CBS 101466) TaxID=1220924 RepID=W2S243_CYPE1|nr:uncharacterized protein HMPREF1541_01812 [Cyphellophora europaea CBS 101466]ETN42655.1 hypothetical protein HMPREF1541_01812 [Cyphellophora europaea CBS 101466]